MTDTQDQLLTDYEVYLSLQGLELLKVDPRFNNWDCLSSLLALKNKLQLRFVYNDFFKHEKENE